MVKKKFGMPYDNFTIRKRGKRGMMIHMMIQLKDIYYTYVVFLCRFNGKIVPFR